MITATPRLMTAVSIGTTTIVAGILTGRPEMAAFAAPFFAIVVLGLAWSAPPDPTIEVVLPGERFIEGTDVAAEIRVGATNRGFAELELEMPPGITIQESSPDASVRTGPAVSLPLSLSMSSWGDHRIAGVTMTTTDLFGILRRRRRVVLGTRLRVHPPTAKLRAMLAPHHVRLLTGNHVSRGRGEGIEFSDVRPLTTGDQMSAVNWRASARRGELWVNERHPERSSDVVLFLDTFADAGIDPDTTLALAVRSAMVLAERHGAVHDRIGLISYGGYYRSLHLGTGARHLHRVVDALLESEIVANAADKSIDVLPARSLPPRAMVVMLTPLLDSRGVDAIFALRSRGHDLSVLDCSPQRYLPAPRDDHERLGRRLWDLDRAAMQRRIRAAAVPLATIDQDHSVEVCVEQLDRARRRQRVAAGTGVGR